MVDDRLPVQLEKSTGGHLFLVSTSCTHQCYEVVVTIGAHQRQFHLGRMSPTIELRNQRRAVWVERRMVKHCQVGGIGDLQAVESVDPQGGERGLDKAEARDDGDR